MLKQLYWFVLLYLGSLITVGLFMYITHHIVLWLAN